MRGPQNQNQKQMDNSDQEIDSDETPEERQRREMGKQMTGLNVKLSKRDMVKMQKRQEKDQQKKAREQFLKEQEEQREK
jgi:hypothetical protein